MIRSYFKTALRFLDRNRSYALINIIGLAVGIGACLLIYLVIQFELSFDNFHVNKERIYRLVSEPYKPGTGFNATAAVPIPVAGALRTDYPQLEKVASIFGSDGQVTIPSDGQEPVKKFNEEGDVYYAEPSFFEIFNFPWLAGHPKSALSNPNSVVLTRETAERYFGDWKKALGKTIIYNNKNVFKVTGILKDLPANSDFPLKIVISYESLNFVDHTDWVGTYGRGYCFVRLPKVMTPQQFNQDLRAFVKKHKPADHANDGIVLQPLSDIHFNTIYGNYNGRVFSRSLINTLIIIGLFILVIACINFINLATAQAINRSKEVSVRKVLGSNRKQLIFQFIGESALISLFATVIAILIASVLLPLMNQFLQLKLSLEVNHTGLIPFLIIILIIIILLSGLYPAFILSRFNPVDAIKNKSSARITPNISLRKGLVVFQFCISQVLIICVLIAASQMRYFHSGALGFDKESIVNVPVPADSLSRSKMNFVREELLKQRGIENVCFSTFSPLDNDIWNNYFTYDHSTQRKDFLTYFKWADADFFNTYRISFIAGQPYSPSDTLRGFVVNETLVKKLALKKPQDILGKDLSFWDKHGPVVGVVKDFHTNSLQTEIVPILIGCWKENYQMVGIKLRPGLANSTLSSIKKIWNAAYPDYVYEYHFLDDKINNYYKEENQLSILYKIFAGIAILISCLGLYGLISFIAVQRTKEVGVRKVLGATALQILYLFSKEFTILVGIAFIIAAPVAYYFMQGWLNTFAYRIHPGVGIFLTAIAGCILIAWLTAGFRAFKAAIVNPADSLRME